MSNGSTSSSSSSSGISRLPEKQRQQESIYRKLYSELLRKNRDVFQNTDTTANGAGSSPYQTEMEQLNTIFRTEVSNLLLGVGVSLTMFTSLRFGKGFIMKRFFGKVQSTTTMKEADRQAQIHGTDMIQKSIATFLEGTFSLWFGYRIYEYTSHQTKSTYDAIAEIPLCKGRSRIADTLCPGWVTITNEKIPNTFWIALDDGKLQDERTWKSIRQFSENCIKRQAYEEEVRRHQKYDLTASSISSTSSSSPTLEHQLHDNISSPYLPTSVPNDYKVPTKTKTYSSKE